MASPGLEDAPQLSDQTQGPHIATARHREVGQHLVDQHQPSNGAVRPRQRDAVGPQQGARGATALGRQRRPRHVHRAPAELGPGGLARRRHPTRPAPDFPDGPLGIRADAEAVQPVQQRRTVRPATQGRVRLPQQVGDRGLHAIEAPIGVDAVVSVVKMGHAEGQGTLAPCTSWP